MKAVKRTTREAAWWRVSRWSACLRPEQDPTRWCLSMHQRLPSEKLRFPKCQRGGGREPGVAGSGSGDSRQTDDRPAGICTCATSFRNAYRGNHLPGTAFRASTAHAQIDAVREKAVCMGTEVDPPMGCRWGGSPGSERPGIDAPPLEAIASNVLHARRLRRRGQPPETMRREL